MINPAIEEVLEKLYCCEFEQGDYPQDEASLDAMKEASSLGLVALGDERYLLTSKGRAAGRDVVRRHRLAECLLRDVLGVRADQVEEDACRFEHILQNALEEKICVLLGHPTTCPHGRAIPQGECCRKASADHIEEVGLLCDGRPGARGVVAYLMTRDNREVQKMMAMGILPGTRIYLIRRFPSYVFQVGYGQFTVDRQLAEMICVHWDGQGRPAGSGPGRRRRRRRGMPRGGTGGSTDSPARGR